MKRRVRVIVTLLGVALMVAGGVFAYDRTQNALHFPERRAWKDAAVVAIDGESSPPAKPEDGDWMNDRVILCADGGWLIYRSQCHKQDPRIHDIFIARASDGRWYYSTFHFCIGAITLRADDQPASLQGFIAKYSLVEFDSRSDEALRRTWPPLPR